MVTMRSGERSAVLGEGAKERPAADAVELDYLTRHMFLDGHTLDAAIGELLERHREVTPIGLDHIGGLLGVDIAALDPELLAAQRCRRVARVVGGRDHRGRKGQPRVRENLHQAMTMAAEDA